MSDYLDYTLIDKLAHAYGWTVNYIQNLEPQELLGFCEAIESREQEFRRILSYIIVLAMNGKSWDSVLEKQSNNVSTENNIENIKKVEEQTKKNTQEMLHMFQVMGMPANQAINGIKKGKLEF